MEHRKEYGSPRDMLDDAMLQRVLSDMAIDDSHRCGERPGCGCQHVSRPDIGQHIPEHPGCGCRDTASVNRPAKPSCSCGRNKNLQQPRQDIQNDAGCSNHSDSCVSGNGKNRLQGFPLAMVYSPNQEWEGILEPEEALIKGTLFTGLLFPWYPSRCHEGRDCGCGRN